MNAKALYFNRRGSQSIADLLILRKGASGSMFAVFKLVGDYRTSDSLCQSGELRDNVLHFYGSVGGRLELSENNK